MLRRALMALLLLSAPAFADAPKMIEATAERTGGTWTFNVTIEHADSGWDHYADAWRIVDGNGTVLGVRSLAHPHTSEQPFTRSLSGVAIPEGVTEVGIQLSDSKTGWTGTVGTLRLR